jgi:hypothetical protein
MQEQTAVLVRHQHEWIFVTEDDAKTERAWQDLQEATKKLHKDGWEIVEGPGIIRPSLAALERFDLWGYRLKRRIH